MLVLFTGGRGSGKSTIAYALYKKLNEENFDYVKYNHRKNINRLGLSVTSLDGGVTGVPDLDSLLQYNNIHGTNITNHQIKVHKSRN